MQLPNGILEEQRLQSGRSEGNEGLECGGAPQPCLSARHCRCQAGPGGRERGTTAEGRGAALPGASPAGRARGGTAGAPRRSPTAGSSGELPLGAPQSLPRPPLPTGTFFPFTPRSPGRARGGQAGHRSRTAASAWGARPSPPPQLGGAGATRGPVACPASRWMARKGRVLVSAPGGRHGPGQAGARCHAAERRPRG